MNKNETPLSLKQICDIQKRKYPTVRRHRCRYPDTFPQPATRRADGDGTSWYPSEIEQFYQTRRDRRTIKNDNGKKQKT